MLSGDSRKYGAVNFWYSNECTEYSPGGPSPYNDAALTLSGRRSAPAAERNKEPILAVLRRVLPDRGLVLEIASGTGQHVVHFARALPDIEWQPSDPDPAARASISAWIDPECLQNVRPPLDLDVCSEPWPIQRADAVVCINMVHISPWSATSHLMAGVARLLPPGRPLVLYGPFRRTDRETAPSNEAFDAQLRRQNPEWGLRNLEDVVTVASQVNIELLEVVDMPANNLAVVFRAA